MGTIVVNRLWQTILVLLFAALVSFSLIRYVGDPVNNMVGQAASLADRLEMRQQLGLDDPVVFQFARFVKSAAVGDLGISYRFGLRVSALLMERLPAPAQPRWRCSSRTTREVSSPTLKILVRRSFGTAVVRFLRRLTRASMGRCGATSEPLPRRSPFYL